MGTTMAAARKRTTVAEHAPNEVQLHERALASLGRRALTRAGVLKVLDAAIQKWARAVSKTGRDVDEVAREVEAARAIAEKVTARLVEVRLIDDAAYAQSNAGRLGRAGKSRRAISVHLAAKGVKEETARAVVHIDEDEELRAAIVMARKKRLGPFARVPVSGASATDDDLDVRAPPRRRLGSSSVSGARPRDDARQAAFKAKNKALASLARAGFEFRLAERVLRMTREEAEARLVGRGEW